MHMACKSTHSLQLQSSNREEDIPYRRPAEKPRLLHDLSKAEKNARKKRTKKILKLNEVGDQNILLSLDMRPNEGSDSTSQYKYGRKRFLLIWNL